MRTFSNQTLMENEGNKANAIDYVAESVRSSISDRSTTAECFVRPAMSYHTWSSIFLQHSYAIVAGHTRQCSSFLRRDSTDQFEAKEDRVRYNRRRRRDSTLTSPMYVSSFANIGELFFTLRKRCCRRTSMSEDCHSNLSRRSKDARAKQRAELSYSSS